MVARLTIVHKGTHVRFMCKSCCDLTTGCRSIRAVAADVRGWGTHGMAIDNDCSRRKFIPMENDDEDDSDTRVVVPTQRDIGRKSYASWHLAAQTLSPDWLLEYACARLPRAY